MAPRYVTAFLLALFSGLVACTGGYSAPVADTRQGPQYLDAGRQHLVNKGETLYAIAWMYDLDFQLIAQVNNLTSPYRINIGQNLLVDVRGVTLRSPQTTQTSPSVITYPASTATSTQAPPRASNTTPVASWQWPAQGSIAERFKAGENGNKGIDISGNRGDTILASAAGEVVYAGRGLLHYGDMIIIKHNNEYLSAYAHNDRILIREGEQVQKGQRIAEMGSTGIDRTLLHFEIRRNGAPVDPMKYLP